jgi:predicted nuclease of predicted toxin-antitoxin system
MKILLDMNLTPSWVQFLRQAGFEAIHWSKVGRHDASDEEIMGFAVQLRARNISPESVGMSVVTALRHTSDELQAGALLTIDIDRTRIRVLPLHSSD